MLRFAAEHASEADISRLRAALEANRDAIGRREEFARTNVAFHQVLAEIPNNSIFTSLQAAPALWLEEQRSVSLIVAQADHHAFETHQEICEAVAPHSPDLAKEAMRRHLEKVGEFYWRSHDHRE